MLTKLYLYNLINKSKVLKLFSERGTTVFGKKHSVILFKDVLKIKRNKQPLKYFYITDSTKKRISSIDIDKISGKKMSALKENSLGCGIIYFKNNLHCLYSVNPKGVYMVVSSRKDIKYHSEPDFAVRISIDGSIYMDYSYEQMDYVVNNPLEMLRIDDSYLEWEEPYIKALKKMEAESVKLGSPEEYCGETYDNNKSEYDHKVTRMKFCWQAFLFIHFARVIDTSVISEDSYKSFSDKVKKINKNVIDIIKVDTFYDKNVHVINPFEVNGHWRNQPYGPGREKTKLIYIDSFMKTGYTRRATKDKINL